MTTTNIAEFTVSVGNVATFSGGWNFPQALRRATEWRDRGLDAEVRVRMSGVFYTDIDPEYAFYVDGKAWEIQGDYWSPLF